MKGGLKVFGLTMLMVAFMAGTAMAAGFGIYEWSARGNALGGAVVANPKDASTAAYNPAGATDLPGHHIYAGFSAITPSSKVDMNNYEDETGKSNTFLPPQFYYTGQLNDKWWLTAGVFTRFGLGTEYDEDWAGRYNMTEAAIQTLSFNPNLVYKINDQCSVGVGVEVMWMEFLQRKSVDRGLGIFGTLNDPDTTGYDSDAKLLGDSIGKGLTLSFYHKPLDWMSVGLVYRSQMKQNIIGDVSFRKRGSQVNGFRTAYSEDMAANGVIILPDSVTLGVAVKPLDKLTVEADLVWTRWSTYEELRIEYEKPLVKGVATTDHSVSRKNWRDTFRYQLGAEYELYDWLDIRGSYIYDQSPIREDNDDYMLPTNDRQLFSAGLGYHWDQYVIDTSYTYLVSKARAYTFRGNSAGIRTGQAHDQDTHIFGLSVGYAF